jgi:hypothetical protein
MKYECLSQVSNLRNDGVRYYSMRDRPLLSESGKMIFNPFIRSGVLGNTEKSLNKKFRVKKQCVNNIIFGAIL